MSIEKNINKIEVLAPAGNFECLKAAVFSGADAVYLGGSLFSARASAVNFTDEELAEAVSFARIRGVKVYVTVNTVIKDRELEAAMSFIGFLCSIPVDGILVQDMGLFSLIADLAPEMPLHCSTQMSIHTPLGAKIMEELGGDRVVLARELSLKEIEDIHKETPVELEAFVHGALCMSVSGQCYFSAMLGSRSGNRGRCAQTCRLPFSNSFGDSNVLSLKDMSFIKHIKDLESAGVCSAKIEGRMKRPEYVAAAVSSCRKSADGDFIPPELLNNLEAVFSRSGFTDGYITGNRQNMLGIRTKEDVVSGTAAVFGRLHELYKNEAGRVPVDGEFSLFSGERAALKLSDSIGNQVTEYSDSVAEKAINRPMSAEALEERISKMGSTPYHLGNITVKTDGESILPASVINEMRRNAADRLSEKRSRAAAVPIKEYDRDKGVHRTRGFKLRAVFRNIAQVPENINALEWAYLPITESAEDFLKLKAMGVKVGGEIPRSFFSGEAEVEEKVKLLMSNGVDVFLCGNVGAVAVCRKLGAVIHGGFSLNITNTESVKAFENIGVRDMELSYELTLEECGAMGAEAQRGIMVYGRQALMLVRNCPICPGGCRGCKKPEYITDRKNTKFPVLCHKGRSFTSVEIFNSVPLSLSDRLSEIKNVDFGILRFTVENSVEIKAVIEDFIRQENPSYDYTRGLFYRGVF